MLIHKTVFKTAQLAVFIGAILPALSYSNDQVEITPTHSHTQASHTIKSLCHEIGNKLGSVNEADCVRQQLKHNGGRSVEGRPLAFKQYPALNSRKPLGKVLLMGGIHGDEYSAISIMFKWMDKLNQYHSGLFEWTVVPCLNPDGLLQNKAQRQNANGVDLNRNFPSKNWDSLALKYWKERTYKNPRCYPGSSSVSEPETIWFTEMINEFAPDVIIAVHAPHRLVDFDGSISAPKRLGNLQLRLLGTYPGSLGNYAGVDLNIPVTYPGSLGNYAGVDLNIPVVTVELASAGIMPSEKEVGRMWVDIVRWLKQEIPKLNKS